MQLKVDFARVNEDGSLATLAAELSHHSLNVTPGQPDRAIEECQRLVCQWLAVDQSQLWQADEGAEESLFLTHLHYRADCATEQPLRETRWSAPADRDIQRPDSPLRTDARAFFPWMLTRTRSGATVVISGLDELPEEAARDRETLAQGGILSVVMLPLFSSGQWLGLVAFGMTAENRIWTDLEVEGLRLAGDFFADALARIRSERVWRDSESKLRLSLAQTQAELKEARDQTLRSAVEIKELKERLKAESDYLKGDIQLNQVHTGIVGQSRSIRKVLQLVEQVAPVSCPVLITGESGTGKELIAQSIHRLSPRARRSMVVVNCAALPASLVESELFGRERGAFTGALSSQAGRFELADQSTIFLDEVAELPLELQGKLLRVLQEGEYERLGNPKTRKVNVRVIAATNRDLAEEVQKKRFREDLFYRLSVFPISLPPLRERAEDIPLLVLSFLEELSSLIGKRVTKVPRRVMGTLERHYWPGNIRELRNVIERGVILSTGDTLRVNLCENARPASQPAVTLAEVERQHIVATLEKTGWQIKGPRGAAKVLDLKPGTLYSRMRKLGVPHRRQKDGMPSWDLNPGWHRLTAAAQAATP